MNLWSMMTMSKSSRMRAVTASPRSVECCSMTSRNCASTRTTGLSEFMLLWKTVEMSRQRRLRRSSSGRCVMSVPSKVMLPPLMRPGRWSRRSRAVPSVVLPEPDSPIRPTNSPGSIEKLTSCTASSARCERGS